MTHRPRSTLIICGAEKAGTTSLFAYLSTHPDVCASHHKETDFFRRESIDLDDYWPLFGDAGPSKVCLEASPGYLAEAAAVAPKLAACLPDARLVFLLRDPVERLVSSFRFYKSRLHLPEGMRLDEFVDACLAHEGGMPAAGPPLKTWHLLALDRGRYEKHLGAFSALFPAEQLLVLRYEELRDAVRPTVMRIAAFAGLDAAHFETQSFERENVTFQVKRRGLQRVALAINDGFEPFWRRHPDLKRRLLKLYRGLNATPPASEPLGDATRQKVDQYYAPTYRYLAALQAGAGIVGSAR